MHECAAFGIPDARLGEVVGLMVHATETTRAELARAGAAGSRARARAERALAARLVGACKGKVAAFKLPVVGNVLWSESPLPRGATGKILKRRIREAVKAARKAAQSRL